MAAFFYIHTHSHLNDREGTPGKSQFPPISSRPLLPVRGAISIPLSIERKIVEVSLGQLPIALVRNLERICRLVPGYNPCTSASSSTFQKGANSFIEVRLYSSHLIIAAKKTWPVGGWIVEVPLYYGTVMCSRYESIRTTVQLYIYIYMYNHIL